MTDFLIFNTAQKGHTVNNDIELPTHPALARLTRLHQVGRSDVLPPVSLQDIGMSNLEELVQTFNQLDEAIRAGRSEEVWELLDKLEPKESNSDF